MRMYFYNNGKKQFGPFSLDELKAQKIQKEYLVWYEGLENWSKAEEIEELKDYFAKFTPPPIERLKTPPPIKKKSYKGLIFIVLGLLFLTGIGYGIYYYFQEKELLEKHNQIVLKNTKMEAEKKGEEKGVKKAKKESTKKVVDEKKRIRNNWEDYISLSSSSYNVDILGGISNLNITIGNNTNYTIDFILVNVEVLKSDGGIWENVKVEFSGIAPNYTVTKLMPRTNRGSNVGDITIEEISSRALDLCYFKKHYNKTDINNDDPYRCY